MKRMIAVLLAVLLGLATCASAAEWKYGLSAAQPYTGVPEVDLDETMGYILLDPRANMPATKYCDTLRIYLPREDIKPNKGVLTLVGEGKDKVNVDFADPKSVNIRLLNDQELENIMWGGGTCIEIRLPKTLNFNETYHVEMKEGCFTASDGKVKSLPMKGKEAWQPALTGDYGVGGLYYEDGVPVEDEEEAEKKNDKKSDKKSKKKVLARGYMTEPDRGDQITFDLLLGGEAKSAVIYSENGSVAFDEQEYTESGTLNGTVTKDDVQWSVVFLKEDGEVLDVIKLDP